MKTSIGNRYNSKFVQYLLVASVDIRMPEGGVTITPVYSLKKNRFSNETGWYYTPGLQTTYFQLRLDGFIPSAIAGSAGLDPNMTLHQSTLTPGPIKMGTGGSNSRSFSGFKEVSGTPIAIRRRFSDTDGDGIDDGDDNCVAAVIQYNTAGCRWSVAA